VTGSGSTFLINANGDNGLATLRYKLKGANIQAAEEPFDAAGAKFATRLVRHQRRVAGRARCGAKELGLKATAVASAPSVKMHAVRAARVALMHTWQSTQTEGWWRQAFDFNGIPYTYISTQDVAKDPNLNAKYDVIVFGPGGGNSRSIIEGMPMWRESDSVEGHARDAEHHAVRQTDDMRPGLGYEGLMNLQKFIKNGGVYIGSVASAQFAIDNGMTNGVSMNARGRGTVTGTFLKSRLSTTRRRSSTASPTASPSTRTTARASRSMRCRWRAWRRSAVRRGARETGAVIRTIRMKCRDVRRSRIGSRRRASDGAAVAVRDPDGRSAAQSAGHHSAGSASARAVALWRAE
jgi:hypothetical protein